MRAPLGLCSVSSRYAVLHLLSDADRKMEQVNWVAPEWLSWEVCLPNTWEYFQGLCISPKQHFWLSTCGYFTPLWDKSLRRSNKNFRDVMALPSGHRITLWIRNFYSKKRKLSIFWELKHWFFYKYLIDLQLELMKTCKVLPKTESAWFIPKKYSSFLLAMGCKDRFQTQGRCSSTKCGYGSWQGDSA